jgi:hypothetical protein
MASRTVSYEYGEASDKIYAQLWNSVDPEINMINNKVNEQKILLF